MRIEVENCYTDEEVISRINFHPSQIGESMSKSSKPNQTQIRLVNKEDEESSEISMKIINHLSVSGFNRNQQRGVTPVPAEGGDKDSCFSPIQQNDMSLSREGAYHAEVAREAIINLQGPCFTSIDYEDITIV